MYSVLFIAAALLCALTPNGVNAVAVQASSTAKSAADCTTYPCLIFEDNFDDFNCDVWEHEITAGGGGNWEFQYYTNNRSNAYTHDGQLFIKPTLTSDKYSEGFLTSGTLDLWGSTPASVCTGNSFYGCLRAGNPDNLINPIQSARLRSVQSFNFRYGRVEISAKMPTGDWIWPAIWMMPKREAYGGWPASGEIDIVEGRGNLDLVNEAGQQRGVNNVGSTMHWGPFWPYNGYLQTTADRGGNFGAAFHKYGVEWDPNSLRILVDDIVMVNAAPGPGGFWDMGNFGLPIESSPWRYSKNVRLAPFDQEFYFLLNVAVGGTNGFFPDSWRNVAYPKPWMNPSSTAFKDFYNAKNQWYPTWNAGANNGENAAMVIDYIRVTKLQPDP